MKQKIQKFGGAMFTPVPLFAFTGIMVDFAMTCMNPQTMGDLANPESTWYKLRAVISAGVNTVFNQPPVLFTVSLPIALTKKQNARAYIETFVIYITFNYFVSEFLNQFDALLSFDFVAKIDGTSDLAMVAGIKTLDTGMIGAILIAGIAVYLHSRFYSKELPDYLGVFEGSTFIVMIGFFVTVPVVILIVLIWPHVQPALLDLQSFFEAGGAVGLFTYNLLRKLLLPFGVHHFIYVPIPFDNVIANGGTISYWVQHLPDFVNSSRPLIELYLLDGFSNGELTKISGVIGVAFASCKTAHPEKRRMAITLMVPAYLIAVVTGITGPLKFTFLFVAPVLYVVYPVLSALSAVVMLLFGVIGNFGQGIPSIIFLNLIPLFKNHGMMYAWILVISTAFTTIYYFVFKFMTLEFNYATPGREAVDRDAKLLTKDEYRALEGKKESTGSNRFDVNGILSALSGRDNILEISNCATRLRLLIRDEKAVQGLEKFKKYGVIGLVKNGTSIQVTTDLDVPKVGEQAKLLLGRG